ncbi:MAG: hypothetical protein IH614_03005 [Desulfuromonadales bacterium]|nr:hypothetical protein [Desulfuromonadales bacterium]
MKGGSTPAPLRATLIGGLRRLRRLLVPELLEYAPLGWDTPLGVGDQGWLADEVAAEERRKWERFAELLAQPGPLGFSHEAASLTEVENLAFHNLHLTYGYALLRAAWGKEAISVLDWGGGLGHYGLLARALLPPEVALDYHCKEVRTLAKLGGEMAPQITWHDDDRCLGSSYDLTLVSGSLQYIRDWQRFLQQIRNATRRYFFLTRTPVVREVPTFLAVQRAYGTRMLHLQFNESELLAHLERLGFRLEREVVIGDRIYIRKGPEDALLKGWLFSV